MPTIQETVQLGIEHHRAGRLQQAEAIYQQVLAADPFQPDALHLLGLVALQFGRYAAAHDYISRAIALRPQAGEFHAHLGRVLQSMGQLENALDSYRRALELTPTLVEAHVGAGLVLKTLGRPHEAVSCYRRALELQPATPEILNSLGNALQESGQLLEAVECFEHCLRQKPNFAEAHNNYGNTLQLLGRFDQAITEYRQAIELRTAYANAHNNLGQALQQHGQHAAALGSYRDSLGIEPDYPNARYNRALLLLLLGDYAEGWDEYEWRWQRTGLRPMAFSEPTWDGADLAGRTILLYAEQGLGDTLQFIRYAPLVQARGGRVVVECQRLLRRILEGCPGIDELVSAGDPRPPFDVQAALMSLPRILQTRLETIPARVPYLAADRALVKRWGEELPAGGELKVGIAWQGDPAHKRDRFRSMPLAAFAPLGRVPGVRLYSLQKGFGSEQLGAVDFPIVDLGTRLDCFADTAAVMQHLDLVVSADTAVIHLAGALGVPAWVAVSFSSDFRWLVERSDSPWYPSVRIFRQSSDRAWAPIFEEMAACLARRELPRRIDSATE